MKNQEEINTTKQTIYRSDIYQTIDLLEQQLKLYWQSKYKGENLYNIHQKFDAIRNELSDLRSRIEDLTEDFILE